MRVDQIDERCGVRDESVNLPRNIVAGSVAMCLFAPVPTLLLYASLVRESRNSGLLDDRRRGCRSRSFRGSSYSSDMSVARLFQRSVANEVNEIRLLASVVSPSDTVPH